MTKPIETAQPQLLLEEPSPPPLSPPEMIKAMLEACIADDFERFNQLFEILISEKVRLAIEACRDEVGTAYFNKNNNDDEETET